MYVDCFVPRNDWRVEIVPQISEYFGGNAESNLDVGVWVSQC